jgi:hypothetical protein
MTLWRWDQDPTPNFPPPVRIRQRKFRHRSELEAWKRRLLADAIEQRTPARKTHCEVETA